MPAKTVFISQSAISSAFLIAPLIESTVASIFTTTPFFNPLETCCPTPIIFSSFSSFISATSATIFDVPMSRAAIISFPLFLDID